MSTDLVTWLFATVRCVLTGWLPQLLTKRMRATGACLGYLPELRMNCRQHILGAACRVHRVGT